MIKCTQCDGEGQVADTEHHEPWSMWSKLPAGSDMAVKMGMVKPIPCPKCKGVKEHPEESESKTLIVDISKKALMERFFTMMRDEYDIYQKYLVEKPTYNHGFLKYIAKDKVRTVRLLELIDDSAMNKISAWVESW